MASANVDTSLSNARGSEYSMHVLHTTLAKLVHLDLTGCVEYDNTAMAASGGYCDVFMGKAAIPPQDSGLPGEMDVAIKRLRIHIQKEQDFEKLLAKELYIWSRLSHENVLPLQGFALDKGFPIVISEWMENGTLREYLKKHPGCSVEDMILGITNGVDYLHKQNVVHSDLKADNVLINRDGHPVICDFGISRMVSATAAFAATTSGGFKGSVRWMARELILNGHHTRESDVWAFGMTAYEILTRKLPYAHLNIDVQVMNAIIGGDLPARPSDYETWSPFIKSVWDTCEKCWISPPEIRITMEQVAQDFHTNRRVGNTTNTGQSKDILAYNDHSISTTHTVITHIRPANTKADQNLDKDYQEDGGSIQVADHSQQTATQPGTRMITSGAVAAETLTADFASAPVFSTAVDIVINMLQLCDKVHTNKHEIRDLVCRCVELLYALKDSSISCIPEIIKGRVDLGKDLLGRIQHQVQSWIERSFFSQLFQRSNVAENIRHCHQDIDSFLKSFNITTTMEKHWWITEFEFAETIDYLSDSRNNHQIQLETVSTDRVQILAMMAHMQDFMGSCPVDDDRHRGLQTNLLTIQKTSGQLLPNIELNHGEVRRVSYNPVGGSTMFDIWEGEYLGQERCAIKVVRGIQNDAPKVRERFLQEVTIWRKVWEIDKGEYILPFWGACLTDGPYPYIVSPWMPYGDAITYVNKYPYVNRKRIIRRIAEGLKILHTYAPPITHGDIKGSNFLIDEKGNPLLSDFGLRKMIEDLTGMPFTQSQGMSESYRWFAPELCYAPGVLSLESDIYAYSMTVLELMTGKEPFLHIRRTPEVLIKMQQGERPRKPEGPEIIQRGLDDKLWDLLTRCWVEDPAARPSIHEVIAELQDD